MRISDWSSDVCSADLLAVGQGRHLVFAGARIRPVAAAPPADRVQSGRAEREGRERHGNDGRGYRRDLQAAVFRRAAAGSLCRASPGRGQIGRAARGDRGGQYGELAVGEVELRKKRGKKSQT